MSDLAILCVEDEAEVRNAVVRDIEPFAQVFRIEEAEDAADARDVVDEILTSGAHIALVLCDHMLPGDSGVEFMVSMNADRRTRAARKVLVTGQAGLADTIKAVNEGGLDHYIAKPWVREELQGVVRQQLTDYVIDRVDDLLPYVAVLDGPRLMNAIKCRADRE